MLGLHILQSTLFTIQVYIFFPKFDCFISYISIYRYYTESY